MSATLRLGRGDLQFAFDRPGGTFHPDAKGGKTWPSTSLRILRQVVIA
jgi:hypothetical protein